MMTCAGGRRPWWLIVLVGSLGCGGCCGGCSGDRAFQAAARGDVESLREALDANPALIDEKLDPFTWSRHHPDKGKQLVHIAAQHGRVKVLELLHERGADLNATNVSDGKQPIHYAAWANRVDAIEWLLDHGVPVDAKEGGTGHAPLHLAAWAEHGDAVALLLARGAAVDGRIAYNDGTPLIEMCRLAWMRDPAKVTAVAKLLLDKGADVNACDKSKETPLHHAVTPHNPATPGAKRQLNRSLIELLLERKADVSARNLSGQAPIGVAPLENPEIAEILIAHGASREQWEARKRDAQKRAEPPPPQKN